MSSLTLDQVTQALDWLSLHERHKPLSKGERVVLMAVWEDLKFKEAAERSGFDPGYIATVASNQLRTFIAKALNQGQPVNKRRLRHFLNEHITTLLRQPIQQLETESLPLAPTNNLIEVMGGRPPEVLDFYGRVDELKDLRQKLREKNCVAVVGPPGVGKSALAAKLIESLSNDPDLRFKSVIWKSIFHGPSLPELLVDLHKLLATSSDTAIDAEAPTSQLISALLDHLRQQRVLLILDSVEAILQGDPLSLDPYGEQYAEYGMLLRRFVEEQNDSRLLLLSRKPLSHVERLVGSRRSACLMKLGGLSIAEARSFLKDQQVKDPKNWDDFVDFVRGNAQILHQAINSIEEFFGGRVKAHIRYSLVADPYFLEAWREQLGPAGSSTTLERWVVSFVAQQIERGIDPVPMSQLLEQEFPGTPPELFVTIRHLSQIDLLIKTQGETEVLLSLPPLMKKYLLSRLAALLTGNVQ